MGIITLGLPGEVKNIFPVTWYKNHLKNIHLKVERRMYIEHKYFVVEAEFSFMNLKKNIKII